MRYVQHATIIHREVGKNVVKFKGVIFKELF